MTSNRAKSIGMAAAECLLLLSGGAPALGQEPLRLDALAVSGEPAPGVAEATFLDLDGAWVNRAGAVAFWARLDGAGLTDLTDQSVWVASDGSLELIAAAGQPAPGLEGRLVSGIGQVAMDDSGRVVVLANLDDGATPYSLLEPPLFTLFGVDAAGSANLIAAENTLLRENPIPPNDPANRLVNAVIWAAASDSGVLAFDGWTNDDALTPWLPGVLAMTVDGRPLVSDRQGAAVVGPGGDVLFRLSFTDAAVDPANPDLVVNALMLDGPADPVPLLLFTNAPQPLLPSVTFADVAQQIAMNAAGDIAFRARTRGEPGASGVWMLSDGVVTPIATQGALVPGSATDHFGAFAGGPAMNLHGDVVVRAITEPDDASQPRQGLWCFPSDEGGPAWEVARSGAAAPVGTDATYVTLTDATITETGRVVFVAGVSGASLGEFTQTALIVRSREGGATTLARTGAETTIDGVPGIVRAVAFAGGRNPDGSRQVRSYGAADQIVFKVEFEDGRSALVRATIGLASDYDHDGGVDVFDLLTYLDLWFAGSPRADLQPAAAIDLADLRAFIDCWFTGVQGGGDCL